MGWRWGWCSSRLIRPASPTLSKKAMRLIRPPKRVMGFAVEVSRTADLGRWDYKNFTSFGEGGGWSAVIRNNPFYHMTCSQIMLYQTSVFAFNPLCLPFHHDCNTTRQCEQKPTKSKKARKQKGLEPPTTTTSSPTTARPR